MTTQKQRRKQYVQTHAEEIGQKFSGNAILFVALFLLTLGLFITWGFGADRMLYIGLGALALTVITTLNTRKQIIQYAHRKLDEQDQHNA